MKLRAYIVALHAAAFAILLAISPAGSGSMTLMGAGMPAAAASYTGPGDSATFVLWGSVARVYNAAKASTATSLADLVDSAAPAVVVCTLRGTAAGTVDLTGTYCTGSVTPATKCAAATGGVCHVSKLYDQVGTNHWVQATGSAQPTLTFNAINSLPTLTFNSGSSQNLTTGSSVSSQSQPYTFETVSKRTANNGDAGILVCGGQSFVYNFNGGVTGQIGIYAGGAAQMTAAETEPAFHVIETTFNNTSSTFNIDGAAQVGPGPTAIGTSACNAAINLGSNLAIQFLDGNISEAGIYAGSYNSGVQSNARTAYGL